jgi:predicted acyl esterase
VSQVMGHAAETGRTENILGMRVIWDAPIGMDDSVVLRADIFLPEEDGSYPAIITYGPYGKGLAFQDGYKSSWNRMVARLSRDHAGLDLHIPELGTCRPREMGSGRLPLHPG